MMKIDVVIPTKDHNEDLFACLRSLNDIVDGKSFNVTVYVVDDHSSKASREDLITSIVKYNIFKNLTMQTIFLSRSSGFAKAANAGIRCVLQKKKPADFVMVLHDDVTILASDFLVRITEEFEEDATAKCVVPMSINKADENSVKILNNPALAAKEINASNANELVITHLKDAASIKVDHAQSFAMMLKPDFLQKSTLFDEEMPASIGSEDSICSEIANAKKSIKVVPAALVSHKCRMLSDENPNQLSFRKQAKAAAAIKKIRAGVKSGNHIIYTFVKDVDIPPKFDAYDEKTTYVCFTTKDSLVYESANHHPWKFFKVNDIAAMLDAQPNSKKMKEFLKMNPHIFFKNHSTSIWFDPIYKNIKDSKELIQKINAKNFLLCGDAGRYDCAYRYLIDLKKSSVMTNEAFENVIQQYRLRSYPPENGFIDSSILIRKHNDERCKQVMSRAWSLMNSTFDDDQLFLNMMMWLCKYDYSCVPMNALEKTYLTKWS